MIFASPHFERFEIGKEGPSVAVIGRELFRLREAEKLFGNESLFRRGFMSGDYQDDDQLNRVIYEILKQIGSKMLMERLHLIAEYVYEHGALADALATTLAPAERCDRRMKKEGFLLLAPHPQKKLRARIRRRKKK